MTHAHPLGREGAVLISLAVAFACNDINTLELIERLIECAESPLFLNRLRLAYEWLQSGTDIEPRMVAAELGNGIAAVESCVTAIFLALAFRERSFDELMDYVILVKGDVDTIAVMSCAIWGAARGFDALPKERLERLEQCDWLQAMAQRFSETIMNRSNHV